MNIFLVVTAVVLSAVVLGAMLLVLVYFGHPDDKEENLMPKIVVVSGLWLACVSVLCLPFDVANSRGDGGGLRVDIIWYVIYIAMTVYLTVIIPFAFFYYEADETQDETTTGCNSRPANAIKFTCGFVIVVVILLVVMYAFLNNTEIPVQRNAIDASSRFVVNVTQAFDLNPVGCTAANDCLSERFFWSFAISFPVYLMAVVSFLGWFLFSTFVGIGFMALPVDLINEYLTRPTPMKGEEYHKKKKDIGDRANQLLKIGQQLLQEMDDPGRAKSKKQKRVDRKTENRFEQAVYMLKKEQQVLFIAHRLKGGNPLWYYLQLVLGCIGVILSITWLIHIGIFMLPDNPFHPFLNEFFIDLEQAVTGFPLFGVTAFCIYTLYLLWCCIKGAFKFGMQIPFFFKIYPMELNNTYLNAFLANTWIIVLCAVPTVQFAAQAFPFYARFTAIDLLFSTQVRYLKFFRYFYVFNVFLWMLLVFAFLTLVYLVINPRDRAALIEQEITKIAQDDDYTL
eukprot:TRINITY_DN3053_c0_g4_i4.p1 TRINITY_DN3053_c0_g4~~TRINITY_DN3053_c0_g4_i4.p1  ORF type:complete len:509 (+),score=180.66 TRINITY_DN3053_c0_g4_i4:155-1681(+)